MVVNTGLLKSPSNWFLVAFVLILLAFSAHFIIKGNS